MTADLDRYVVIKLISGEEIIGTLVKEDDYDIKLQFPMMVKKVNRLLGDIPVESIVLGTYSHFCADDEFTFNKQHIIILKDMDPRYIDEYHRSVDDFIGASSPEPEAYNPNEVQQLTDKLKSMFRDKLNENEDYPEIISLNVNGTKTIH
jgi:hypothetical protein